MIPAELSEAQRAFIRAAKTARATTLAGALPLASLPRLSTAELDELVERGLVRQAADRRYYVFHTGRAVVARFVRVYLFWLLVLLIPVFLIPLVVLIEKAVR
jgi:hypothetical protein